MTALRAPMDHLSPFDAALEGLGVLRRAPRAAAVWMLLWLAALSASAIVMALGAPVVVSDPGSPRGVLDIGRQFGPFAALFIALFLLVWVTTTVATFRAVLEPTRRAGFFLRLGADEARLAVMTIAAVALVLVLGGLPALILFELVSPLMAAMPAMARDVATLGAIATVCLDIWLAVRLSLIAVETVAEKRFHLTAYWPLTRGRFWYLLTSYAVCFVIFFAVIVAFALAGVLLGQVQAAVGAPNGADPVRRVILLGLAGALAVLTASFLVISTTLFCACQAHLFRAIAGGESNS